MATHNGRKIPYLLGVLLGLDQFANALLPKSNIDETISSRLGRAKKEGRLNWKRRPLARLTYEWLNKIDPGHCEKSIE